MLTLERGVKLAGVDSVGEAVVDGVGGVDGVVGAVSGHVATT